MKFTADLLVLTCMVLYVRALPQGSFQETAAPNPSDDPQARLASPQFGQQQQQFGQHIPPSNNQVSGRGPNGEPAVVPQGEQELSSGADLILGPRKAGFDCNNKVYGFYADTFNDCKLFHVCWPVSDERGLVTYKQWSFFCGNQTVFNQVSLTCDHPDNVDCSLSEQYYSLNNEIGQANTLFGQQSAGQPGQFNQGQPGQPQPSSGQNRPPLGQGRPSFG